MDTALALLALLTSLVALTLALRASRDRGAPSAPPAPPPRPPPPPLPPGEDGAARVRLDRLETGRQETAAALRTLAEHVERVEAGWSKEADALRTSLGRLEASLESLAALRSDPEPEPDVEPEPDPEARVREHLLQAGWDDVVLLPAEPGAWRVEARRGSGLVKGRARLFPDGRVEAQLKAPTRAFP